jgi:hypothetical protein
MDGRLSVKRAIAILVCQRFFLLAGGARVESGFNKVFYPENFLLLAELK